MRSEPLSDTAKAYLPDPTNSHRPLNSAKQLSTLQTAPRDGFAGAYQCQVPDLTKWGKWEGVGELGKAKTSAVGGLM